MKALLVSQRGTRVMLVLLMAAVVGTLVFLPSTGLRADAAAPARKVCQDKGRTCTLYPNKGWKKVKSGKASGGTYHLSRSKTKPVVVLAGAGPQIEFVTATGPNRGTAKVTVFDMSTGEAVKSVKFKLEADRSHFKVVKKIKGLQRNRQYSVAVVAANRKPVVLDAFKGFALGSGGNQSPPQLPPGAESPSGVEPPTATSPPSGAPPLGG
jgi:hypothetical protein